VGLRFFGTQDLKLETGNYSYFLKIDF
jgi:hypothetical protein